ncbi:DUF429 domain-containing protein [Paenibacillus sp. HJGM_3]|uniref:DUF429 domain-containing protein n=1 Tax=Paenibacillus sp. HJGM_3 TaxID=3379816 RepID=UPI00385895EF
MLIIGVDCAVSPKNVGISVLDYSGKKFLPVPSNPDPSKTLLHILEANPSRKTLLCLDAPLGWPSTFAPGLIGHSAGEYLGNTLDSFFKRDTDLFCYYLLKKIPLDVASDKIARTTYKTLEMLNAIRVRYPYLKMLWDPQEKYELGFIEVYPAAWLVSELITPHVTSYKGTKDIHQARRMEMLERIQRNGMDMSVLEKRMIEDEHFFDACVCCLCGMDFVDLRAIKPFPQLTSVKKEGWIWLKPVI